MSLSNGMGPNRRTQQEGRAGGRATLHPQSLLDTYSLPKRQSDKGEADDRSSTFPGTVVCR
jgi:hypothetical protein